jgi:alpha 1,2-mannosyltransferase
MDYFEKNGIRNIGFDLQKSAISEFKVLWKNYTKKIKPYPGKFSGRGIVTCAGGIRYFTCAWIMIKTLRKNGCTLPVELWYLGNELTNEAINEISKYNVVCKNILNYGPCSLTGYMLKPLAIIKSSFKEILFLDADNVCIRNPEELFDAEEYAKYGTIFWPDFWETSPKNPIWKITNSVSTNSKEQESGQILINKERCWKELNLCLHFNRLHIYYYKLLLGDKDTFRFAWIALKTPFYMIDIEPAVCGYLDNTNIFCGNTMIQHNLKKEFYFLHRNLVKWDVTKSEKRVWKIIKRFNSDAQSKEYFFTVSNGKYFMDIKGDVEELNFCDFLPDYECMCIEFLEELRTSQFYDRFITSLR